MPGKTPPKKPPRRSLSNAGFCNSSPVHLDPSPSKAHPILRTPSQLYHYVKAGHSERSPNRGSPIIQGPEFIVRSKDEPMSINLCNVSRQKKISKTITVVTLSGIRVELQCNPESISISHILKTLIGHGIPCSPEMGLAFLHKGEFIFTKGKTKIINIAPKGWTTLKETSKQEFTFDNFNLYLRFASYPMDFGSLSYALLHCLYLQLRHDTIEGRFPAATYILCRAAALALTVEFGDCDTRENVPCFLPEHYLPEYLITSPNKPSHVVKPQRKQLIPHKNKNIPQSSSGSSYKSSIGRSLEDISSNIQNIKHLEDIPSNIRNNNKHLEDTPSNSRNNTKHLEHISFNIRNNTDQDQDAKHFDRSHGNRQKFRTRSSSVMPGSKPLVLCRYGSQLQMELSENDKPIELCDDRSTENVYSKPGRFSSKNIFSPSKKSKSNDYKSDKPPFSDENSVESYSNPVSSVINTEDLHSKYANLVDNVGEIHFKKESQVEIYSKYSKPVTSVDNVEEIYSKRESAIELHSKYSKLETSIDTPGEIHSKYSKKESSVELYSKKAYSCTKKCINSILEIYKGLKYTKKEAKREYMELMKNQMFYGTHTFKSVDDKSKYYLCINNTGLSIYDKSPLDGTLPTRFLEHSYWTNVKKVYASKDKVLINISGGKSKIKMEFDKQRSSHIAYLSKILRKLYSEKGRPIEKCKENKDIAINEVNNEVQSHRTIVTNLFKSHFCHEQPRKPLTDKNSATQTTEIKNREMIHRGVGMGSFNLNTSMCNLYKENIQPTKMRKKVYKRHSISGYGDISTFSKSIKSDRFRKGTFTGSQFDVHKFKMAAKYKGKLKTYDDESISSSKSEKFIENQKSDAKIKENVGENAKIPEIDSSRIRIADIGSLTSINSSYHSCINVKESYLSLYKQDSCDSRSSCENLNRIDNIGTVKKTLTDNVTNGKLETGGEPNEIRLQSKKNMNIDGSYTSESYLSCEQENILKPIPNLSISEKLAKLNLQNEDRSSPNSNSPDFDGSLTNLKQATYDTGFSSLSNEEIEKKYSKTRNTGETSKTSKDSIFKLYTDKKTTTNEINKLNDEKVSEIQENSLEIQKNTKEICKIQGNAQEIPKNLQEVCDIPKDTPEIDENMQEIVEIQENIGEIDEIWAERPTTLDFQVGSFFRSEKYTNFGLNSPDGLSLSSVPENIENVYYSPKKSSIGVRMGTRVSAALLQKRLSGSMSPSRRESFQSPMVLEPSLTTTPNYDETISDTLLTRFQDITPCTSPIFVERRLNSVTLVKEDGSIGLQVAPCNDGNIYITGISVGGPAYAAGLRKGDRLLGVNGLSVESVPYDQALDMLKNTTESVTLLVSQPVISKGTESTSETSGLSSPIGSETFINPEHITVINVEGQASMEQITMV